MVTKGLCSRKDSLDNSMNQRFGPNVLYNSLFAFHLRILKGLSYEIDSENVDKS